MTSFHEHKQAARLALHDHMAQPAIYIAPDDSSGIGASINVRVWTQSKQLGDLLGNGADRVEEVPRILFMLSEIQPERGAVVSVAEGVAYRVDRLQPTDDISVVAFVTRLKDADAAGLPLPESV